MKAWQILTAITISVVVSHAFATAAPQAAVGRPSIGVTNRIQATQTKPEIIARLKIIQQRQSTSLQSSDQTIRKLFEETQSIRLGTDQILSERQLQTLYKRLAAAMTEKEEFQLRYDFISQLIFQIDSKWGSDPLQEFLEHQLIEMAITDAASANSVKLWKFYSYLSIAIREIPEKREDLVGFIDGYLEFSSIKDPKSPALYVNTRNYTNGASNQTAHPINREQLGATVEKKMKDLETIGIGVAPTPSATPNYIAPTETPTESAEAMEIRTRVPQSKK